MSLIDSFNLSNYETEEELNELLLEIDHEQSTLRGYERGAREKLETLLFDNSDDDE